MIIMYQDQMELSLPRGGQTVRCNPLRHRSPRAAPTARWWFARMRQLVDAAVDYPPADAGRALASQAASGAPR